MKKLLFVCLLFSFIGYSASLYSKNLNGLYISIVNTQSSIKYTDISSAPSSDAYSKNLLNLFFSIYSENFFEANLSLSKDNYLIKDSYELCSRYSIGFELGKMISFDIIPKNKSIISSDISGGAFYKFNFLGPTGSKKFYSEFGLYALVKAKIKLHEKFLKLNSIDIGYKFSWPFNFNYYSKDDYAVITRSSSLFVGFSF